MVTKKKCYRNLVTEKNKSSRTAAIEYTSLTFVLLLISGYYYRLKTDKKRFTLCRLLVAFFSLKTSNKMFVD